MSNFKERKNNFFNEMLLFEQLGLPNDFAGPDWEKNKTHTASVGENLLQRVDELSKKCYDEDELTFFADQIRQLANSVKVINNPKSTLIAVSSALTFIMCFSQTFTNYERSFESI